MRDPLLRLGKRYYLRGLLARLRHEANPRPRPKCVALRSHVRLLPDGSVPVCQFNTEKVGNLVKQSWEEVWQSAATASAGVGGQLRRLLGGVRSHAERSLYRRSGAQPALGSTGNNLPIYRLRVAVCATDKSRYSFT